MQLNAVTNYSSELSIASTERWFSLSWVILDLSHLFTRRKQLKDLSHEQLVTGTVNAIWNMCLSVVQALSSKKL